MSKKLTQKQVIEKFKAAHGNKYDYSLVNYVNNVTKVSIICRVHGVFEQRPADHKVGIGCVQCGFESMKSKQRHTQEYIISKFKNAHGDRYDYSQVKYVNSKTHVTIICRTHGPFFQEPEFHKNGHGCPQCGIEKNASNRRLKYDDLITGQLIVHVVDKDGNKSELKAGLKTTSIKRKELLISNVRRFMESNKGFSPTKIEIRSPKKYGKAI